MQAAKFGVQFNGSSPVLSLETITSVGVESSRSLSSTDSSKTECKGSLAPCVCQDQGKIISGSSSAPRHLQQLERRQLLQLKPAEGTVTEEKSDQATCSAQEKIIRSHGLPSGFQPDFCYACKRYFCFCVCEFCGSVGTLSCCESGNLTNWVDYLIADEEMASETPTQVSNKEAVYPFALYVSSPQTGVRQVLSHKSSPSSKYSVRSCRC